MAAHNYYSSLCDLFGNGLDEDDGLGSMHLFNMNEEEGNFLRTEAPSTARAGPPSEVQGRTQGVTLTTEPGPSWIHPSQQETVESPQASPMQSVDSIGAQALIDPLLPDYFEQELVSLQQQQQQQVCPTAASPVGSAPPSPWPGPQAGQLSVFPPSPGPPESLMGILEERSLNVTQAGPTFQQPAQQMQTQFTQAQAQQQQQDQQSNFTELSHNWQQYVQQQAATISQYQQACHVFQSERDNLSAQLQQRDSQLQQSQAQLQLTQAQLQLAVPAAANTDAAAQAALAAALDNKSVTDPETLGWLAKMPVKALQFWQALHDFRAKDCLKLVSENRRESNVRDRRLAKAWNDALDDVERMVRWIAALAHLAPLPPGIDGNLLVAAQKLDTLPERLQEKTQQPYSFYSWKTKGKGEGLLQEKADLQVPWYPQILEAWRMSGGTEKKGCPPALKQQLELKAMGLNVSVQL